VVKTEIVEKCEYAHLVYDDKWIKACYIVFVIVPDSWALQ
jgi:hypothetical protein